MPSCTAEDNLCFSHRSGSCSLMQVVATVPQPLFLILSMHGFLYHHLPDFSLSRIRTPLRSQTSSSMSGDCSGFPAYFVLQSPGTVCASFLDKHATPQKSSRSRGQCSMGARTHQQHLHCPTSGCPWIPFSHRYHCCI